MFPLVDPPTFHGFCFILFSFIDSPTCQFFFFFLILQPPSFFFFFFLILQPSRFFSFFLILQPLRVFFCFLDPSTSQGPGELLWVPKILLQAARESSLSGLVYFIQYIRCCCMFYITYQCCCMLCVIYFYNMFGLLCLIVICLLYQFLLWFVTDF